MVDSIGISLLISLLVCAVATPLGFLAARYVAYHPRREQLLITAYAPYVFSPVILATVLLYLYLKLDLVGSMLGVLAAQIMFAAGFALIFFVPFWNDHKRRLEELVYTLGGNRRQAFTQVLLPLFREPLLICAFQTFLISWTQYGTTLLIGAGKVQTLPLKVYDFVAEANPQYAAMAATLLILPPALLIWFNRKLALISSQEPL
nr:ABC transporter permease subunit [Acanthopleuribacter pedis]